MKPVYTVKDISKELQVSERSLRNLIKRGELKANKVLGKWLVAQEDYKKLAKVE